jgi:hypothetical protein
VVALLSYVWQCALPHIESFWQGIAQNRFISASFMQQYGSEQVARP